MSPYNFQDWRVQISGRKKFRQILEAFTDTDLNSNSPKYVCAPCTNCKGQMRDMLQYFGAKQKSGIHYGGLVELVVNAMVDVKQPLLKFEEM
jgi:Fe-S oxidoreductase